MLQPELESKTQNAADARSKWIQIADDKSGLGFAESHPTAELYNHANIKYNSDGEQFSYLKGDVVKVQAHCKPRKLLYMEAQTDVPRNISLEQLFSAVIISGANGFFNYVGSDSSWTQMELSQPLTSGADEWKLPITRYLYTSNVTPGAGRPPSHLMILGP